MRLNFIFIILLSAISVSLLAQPSKDTTVILKIKSPKSVISVFPDDNELRINSKKEITIRNKGKNKIIKVELKGGTITGSDSLYTISASEGKIAILTIYTKTSDGKSKLALTKSYEITPPPIPIIYVNGVKCDSTIEKLTLAVVGQLKAFLPKEKIYIPIISFEMNMANPVTSKIDTLKAKDGFLTKEMRVAVYKKKKGSVVYFENIKCMLPDKSIVTIPVSRVFLIETPIYKFQTN